MKLPEIIRENDTLILLQDLSELNLYEKSKAIVNFCDRETKLFEREIDRAILEIFLANGINIPSNEKSVLKRAYNTLKGKGKTIEITDMLKDSKLDGCEFVALTKNHFIVLIEDNRYLQVCVRVKEKKNEIH